jgi:hypothetical protein
VVTRLTEDVIVLLVILILLIVLGGVGPWTPWGRPWGYYPAGGLGLVLLVLLVLLLAGAVPPRWGWW